MSSAEQREASGATAEQLHLVEELALSLERMGLFRMAGRVVAWLLICDPAEQSFVQLTETLQASKGSISAALRLLTASGMVERRSRPGERRDYYRIRDGAWPELVRQEFAEYSGFASIIERGMGSLPADAPQRARMQEFFDFFTQVYRQIQPLIDRWEAERGRQ